MTTKNTEPMSSIPQFSIRSLHQLLKSLCYETPELMRTDWRQMIRTSFELSPDQELSLAGFSEERVQAIQKEFVRLYEHTLAGGTIKGRISMPPKELQTPESAHALDLTTTPLHGGADAQSTSLRIVTCDPRCRNWKWFPGG